MWKPRQANGILFCEPCSKSKTPRQSVTAVFSEVNPACEAKVEDHRRSQSLAE